MFMEVLVVELVRMCNLNTLRCLYCQHGTSCAWVKGLMKANLLMDLYLMTKCISSLVLLKFTSR